MTSCSPHSCEPQSLAPKPAPPLHWLVRAFSAARRWFAELKEAQMEYLIASMSYDRELPSPDRAPETYPEFRLRTSGPARHEPTARQREAGRRVR